ncbi:MAG: hypothetical protein ACRDIV_08265 [Ktedonobacteraceae bacterium]
MQTSRWLLPFTFGVDMRAIDYAVRLAESAGATLVPVSLVSAPPKGARLEHIQQSKDFLEAVQNKAERFQVPTERYEAFTADVLQSIATLVHDTCCNGIILVTGGEYTHLLRDEEVKRLLIKPPTALVLMRLSPPAGLTSSPHLAARFLSWWRGLWGRQDAIQVQDEEASSLEEPLWIRTEQRHLG